MLDESAEQLEQLYRFGPFSLSPKQRLLLENGEPVRLGCRAIELLIVLVARNGEVLGKEELIARIWPNINVVEGNLTAQMTALRRALHDGRDGSRYILNEHGRGYRFIAPVIAIPDWELGLPAPQVPGTADQASPSFMRLVELCYSLLDPTQKRLRPRSEEVMLDAILQRGILALEFARTLVSAPDQLEVSGSETHEQAGNGLTRYASRWLETAQAAASH